MKNLIYSASSRFLPVAACFLLLAGCSKDSAPLPANQQSFTVVNLVASDATFSGARVDPHLLNAWGLAFSPTGTAWVSSTGDHTSAVYTSTGAQALPAVTIPTHGAATGGIPTGQVFNNTTGFVLPNGNPAKFIFAGIDGVISGWNGGTGAITAVDRNGTSVYTGLAIGAVATDTFLYAADFNSGKIDMYNKNFVLQPNSFTDPGLPPGYNPFNVQNIGGQLFVTYAQPDPVTHTEKKAAGLGLVNIFNTNGTFVRRFVSNNDKLNAPWGIAQAPSGWLSASTGTTVYLVGNLGDGRINAYSITGQWFGALQNNGTPITIDGLWSLSFPPATATAINPSFLYFTAGPAGETKGLFGYVTP